jgi:hypothetical protein
MLISSTKEEESLVTLEEQFLCKKTLGFVFDLKTQWVSIEKFNSLMLFEEIIAVYSKNHEGYL